MRSIELINSVLAPKKEEKTEANIDMSAIVEKLDNIGATMEGIFNKLTAQTEITKKTKAKKTDVDETEVIEDGKSE